MDRRYQDPDWLEEQYHEQGLTQREIGEMCGVSASAIRKWMKKFDIPTRELVGENHPLFGKERDESVKEQISEALTGREFSEATKRRMAKAHRGRTIPAETREKISKSLLGEPKPPETRRRMSEARLGDKVGEWNAQRWMDAAYASGWQRVRARIQSRVDSCEHCGKHESEEGLQIHHIIPLRMFHDSTELSFGDAHTVANLIPLCPPCHIQAEYGKIEIEPDFDEFPDKHLEEYRRLWELYRQNLPRSEPES